MKHGIGLVTSKTRNKVVAYPEDSDPISNFFLNIAPHACMCLRANASPPPAEAFICASFRPSGGHLEANSAGCYRVDAGHVWADDKVCVTLYRLPLPRGERPSKKRVASLGGTSSLLRMTAFSSDHIIPRMPGYSSAEM